MKYTNRFVTALASFALLLSANANGHFAGPSKFGCCVPQAACSCAQGHGNCGHGQGCAGSSKFGCCIPQASKFAGAYLSDVYEAAPPEDPQDIEDRRRLLVLNADGTAYSYQSNWPKDGTQGLSMGSWHACCNEDGKMEVEVVLYDFFHFALANELPTGIDNMEIDRQVIVLSNMKVCDCQMQVADFDLALTSYDPTIDPQNEGATSEIPTHFRSGIFRRIVFKQGFLNVFP